MSRSIQLVLLCVVTLSYIQLGRAQNDVQGLSKAVKQVLLPIMKSIKDDLNSVKGELTSLNETVSQLSGDINSVKRELTSLNESVNIICDKMEEHEDHMTIEIMELEEHLQSNFTHQLKHSYGYINPLPQSCDGKGGWRRAVYLDMTNTRTSCPRGWSLTSYSKRTCGRATNGYRTCDSVTFSVSGGEYSQVCGRIRAYQWGWTSGFYGSHAGYRSLDDAYFTGVAVMHGSPRQHIWTFVAGRDENYPSGTNYYLCPCDGIRSDRLTIPPFVGEDYFCESGVIYPDRLLTFHPNDTLWDGRDCHSSSTCCSLHNPPYFTKTLNTSTTDDIELRMCIYENMRTMNIAVELVELYVK